MPFIQAAHFTPGRKKPVSLIVLHDMEAPKKPTTARAVAGWFAGKQAPQASAHFCVDSENVVQCVRESDTAWHVRGGDINARSIGIELAGYASQSPEDWADEFNTSMLNRAAALVAKLCVAYSIPCVALTAEQVASGASGITTHRVCTAAFHVAGGHVDPGPNFPMDDFLIRVRSYEVYPE